MPVISFWGEEKIKRAGNVFFFPRNYPEKKGEKEMTFEEFTKILRELERENDIDLYQATENTTVITFNDFIGFDEDWEEVFREYNRPDLVGKVEDLLEDTDKICFGEHRFVFDYTSRDI